VSRPSRQGAVHAGLIASSSTATPSLVLRIWWDVLCTSQLWTPAGVCRGSWIGCSCVIAVGMVVGRSLFPQPTWVPAPESLPEAGVILIPPVYLCAGRLQDCFLLDWGGRRIYDRSFTPRRDGKLQTSMAEQSSSPGALDPNEWRHFEVVEKDAVTHNTSRLRSATSSCELVTRHAHAQLSCLQSIGMQT
jgi:hypothetical protein